MTGKFKFWICVLTLVCKYRVWNWPLLGLEPMFGSLDLSIDVTMKSLMIKLVSKRIECLVRKMQFSKNDPLIPVYNAPRNRQEFLHANPINCYHQYII